MTLGPVRVQARDACCAAVNTLFEEPRRSASGACAAEPVADARQLPRGLERLRVVPATPPPRGPPLSWRWRGWPGRRTARPATARSQWHRSVQRARYRIDGCRIWSGSCWRSSARTPIARDCANTPKRVEKALTFLTSGYGADIDEVLNNALFTVDYSEMVIVKDIDFYSLCEHHLLPFFGKCHVAYIPSNKVIGLSKIPRLVDVFSRRLQVQERLTNQIADTIREKIAPLGVAVVIEATHLCMSMRGVEKQNSFAITSAMLGAFRIQRADAHGVPRTDLKLRKRAPPACGTNAAGASLAGVDEQPITALLSSSRRTRRSPPAACPCSWIDRTGVAIVGAILMVVTGAIGFDRGRGCRRLPHPRAAVQHDDHRRPPAPGWRPGGVARLTGRASASRAALLIVLVFASGILSALFVNDTVCLVFTPVVLDIVAGAPLRPLPFLLALATASNIGSVATITGNPQNILIGSVSGSLYRASSPRSGRSRSSALLIDALLLCVVFRARSAVRPRPL